MTYNLSALFESVAGVVPDRTAICSPARTLTYSELDARADRLAVHLRDSGVGRGDRVGLQLQNGTEYVEAMLAAFKLSAVPVNINYRYVARELEYLYSDADLKALIYHRRFSPVVGEVLPRVSRVAHLIDVVDESAQPPVAGSVEYEDALGTAPPDDNWTGRSSDDLYLTYTGGTTGMPKGVIWRHEDLFFAALGGGDPMRDKGPISQPAELPGRAMESIPLTLLLAPPLMHVSAHWGAFNAVLTGWKIVLGSPGRFDPDEIWRLVEGEKVNSIILVGDAMARPLLDELRPTTDVSSLLVIGSGGAILSPVTKELISRRLPHVVIIDTLASSETGTTATRLGNDNRFAVDERTAVVDEDLRPVTPGSGTMGRLARRGHVPLRYHNDEEKSAATFVEFGGHRWVVVGDMATVAADGTIELLGRGSGCINTGGEKVFPEEVEAVLKGHPDVVDVVVVGVPDKQFGSKVVAVVQAKPGVSPELASLQAHARSGLAGYKVPRAVFLVDEVKRGPNGKPDYPWAEGYARTTMG